LLVCRTLAVWESSVRGEHKAHIPAITFDIAVTQY
jgi:hypothetical protein